MGSLKLVKSPTIEARDIAEKLASVNLTESNKSQQNQDHLKAIKLPLFSLKDYLRVRFNSFYQSTLSLHTHEKFARVQNDNRNLNFPMNFKIEADLVNY